MISDINIHIDSDRCYACGICVDRCIMDNLRLFVAPCRSACPIDMNCQGYVRLIAQGKEVEGAEAIQKFLPFAGILGRVCHRPCESLCERAKMGDGAVHIRALKRYLSENYPEIAGLVPNAGKKTGKRVAIVGSGPAGLMAAYELTLLGHDITVFEASSEPGGLLRWAIPSFVLPIKVVDESIKILEKMGIQFKTGQKMGETFELKGLEKEFDAVLLATGASESLPLKIPGEDMQGVYHGLDLLRHVKEGKVAATGNSVIVIGGGNSAVDCALTFVKLGAKVVRIVCLEERQEMPAMDTELETALEEGIIFENSCGPRRIIKKENGRLGLETSYCIRVFDDDGEFRPILENECKLDLEADTIIIAIGQKIENSGIPPELIKVNDTLAADETTLQSVVNKKIFCAGDAIKRPGSVVDAMAQGQAAAVSIDRFITGDGLKWGRDTWAEKGCLRRYEVDDSRAIGGKRGALNRIPVEQRTIDTEIEMVLAPEQARKEAERCLSCGRPGEFNKTCWYCLPCEIDCPTNALQVKLPYQIR
jgi:NADPH-dependent glutamate synthase beta subunit-like oxidoreductase